MDRRILKTKKALKEALRQLLAQKPFEKITVTEICDEANTGRLTFYKYYTDKNSLLEDCFQDIQEKMKERFATLQQSNPDNNFQQSFINMMDAIMDIASRDSYMISRLFYNSDTLLLYYQFIMRNLESFELHGMQKLNDKYDPHRLNSFFTMGLWGFVYANGPDFDEKETREKARMLIGDLLRSDIFQKD